MGVFIVNILRVALFAAWLLVISRVLLSWFDPAGRTEASRYVYRATEPVLAPIRRALPPAGGLDLAPLVVLVVLSLLTQFV
jgi:YggT family protein